MRPGMERRSADVVACSKLHATTRPVTTCLSDLPLPAGGLAC